MFPHIFLITFVALLLAWGPACALEPVPPNVSVSEMASKVSDGKIVFPVPQARITPMSEQKKPRPLPSPVVGSSRHSSAAPKNFLSAPSKRPPAPQRSKKVAAPRGSPPGGDYPHIGRLATATAKDVPSAQKKNTVSLPARADSAQKALKPPVRAKAMFCLDCSSNKVMLAENTTEPLPIASITKLLTAMIVVEEMNLDQVLEVPADITLVERHKVGIRPGDLFTVRDLLHGMLIESGNDCAEVLARAYPKGGRDGFMSAMNQRAARLGAGRTILHTPSGLDMKMTLGRKDGRSLDARRPNTATAEDVALIAREAFKHPLIARISSMKTYTMRTRNTTPRDYPIASNDKLLTKNLPVAGAKTGFTNMAGKCIVALFKDQKNEHMVVVLNTPHHFKAAEKIYRWASRAF